MGPQKYSTFSARAGEWLWVQVTARPDQLRLSPGKVRMPGTKIKRVLTQRRQDAKACKNSFAGRPKGEPGRRWRGFALLASFVDGYGCFVVGLSAVWQDFHIGIIIPPGMR